MGGELRDATYAEYAKIRLENCSHSAFMQRELTMKGEFMSSRQNVFDLIKMIETGVLMLEKGTEGHSRRSIWRSGSRLLMLRRQRVLGWQHLLSLFLEAT